MAEVAIVGSGVAGLTAAWLLRKKHDVHVFERNAVVGGHTRTLTLPDGPDAGTPVDTGFIVMNHRNYPLFTRLLQELDVALGDSDMSFSFTDAARGYCYAGSSLRSLFPRVGHLLRCDHWSMLRDILRFNRQALVDLEQEMDFDETLGGYIERHRFGAPFQEHYLLPMGAAIWSAPTVALREFPARAYLYFFRNHGLLQLKDRPQWRFVRGGSRRYVEAIVAALPHEPRCNCAPISVRRLADAVELSFADGTARRFDQVVIATHADEALRLLADPSADEQRLLGCWSYQPNEVVLHSDASVMPPDRAAWASWNVVREADAEETHPVSVSYHMNRLQRLQTECAYFVSLNRTTPFAPGSQIDRTVLHHPIFDGEALRSQEHLPRLNGTKRTWFCGSYFGYGFHEDAVRSAVDLARAMGVAW